MAMLVQFRATSCTLPTRGLCKNSVVSCIESHICIEINRYKDINWLIYQESTYSILSINTSSIKSSVSLKRNGTFEDPAVFRKTPQLAVKRCGRYRSLHTLDLHTRTISVEVGPCIWRACKERPSHTLNTFLLVSTKPHAHDHQLFVWESCRL